MGFGDTHLGCAGTSLGTPTHESNPLDSVKLSELDALFSYQPQRAAKSVTTWGQLGLDGVWHSQPVRLYALDTETGTGRFFRQTVLGGTRHLNWSRLREFKARSDEGEPSSAIANRALRNALKEDRFGLAVAIADSPLPGIKALAVSACDGCEAVTASPESVSNGSYPLSREVLAYFNHPAGQEMDPVLADFLDFVRGPGQSLIRPNDGYLPLTRIFYEGHPGPRPSGAGAYILAPARMCTSTLSFACNLLIGMKITPVSKVAVCTTVRFAD